MWVLHGDFDLAAATWWKSNVTLYHHPLKTLHPNSKCKGKRNSLLIHPHTTPGRGVEKRTIQWAMRTKVTSSSELVFSRTSSAAACASCLGAVTPSCITAWASVHLAAASSAKMRCSISAWVTRGSRSIGSGSPSLDSSPAEIARAKGSEPGCQLCLRERLGLLVLGQGFLFAYGTEKLLGWHPTDSVSARARWCSESWSNVRRGSTMGEAGTVQPARSMRRTIDWL